MMKKRLKLLTILYISLCAILSVSGREITQGATLEIPVLNIQAEIINAPFADSTWDVEHLQTDYVGHLEGMPWLNNRSNIPLAGHSEYAGKDAIFSRLHQLEIGDEIFLHQNGKKWLYRVIEIKVVDDNDISILYPTMQSQLTLFTCTISSYDSERNNYTRRTVIVARFVKQHSKPDSPKEAPSMTLHKSPKASLFEHKFAPIFEQPLTGDSLIAWWQIAQKLAPVYFAQMQRPNKFAPQSQLPKLINMLNDSRMILQEINQPEPFKTYADMILEASYDLLASYTYMLAGEKDIAAVHFSAATIEYNELVESVSQFIRLREVFASTQIQPDTALPPHRANASV